VLWSPQVGDLFKVYNNFREKIKKKSPTYTYTYIDFEAIEQTLARLQKVTWYYNERLKEAYESGNEVLLRADKVYLIKEDSKVGMDVEDYLWIDKEILT